jgi:predicted N-acetyltransferase YhbS
VKDPAGQDDDLILRAPTEADIEECGRIVWEAFDGVSSTRSFPPEFPSPEAAAGLIAAWIGHPAVFGVVAERNGRVVGSNFLDERDPIRGVGPISVDPEAQASGAGRALMEAVLERGRDAAGIRLLQDAHNPVSMSLYASLGFVAREPVVRIGGRPAGAPSERHEVRTMEERDLEACERLCGEVHGFSRTGELRDALTGPMLTPLVALRDGRVRAYASSVAMWQLAHGVAETEEDLTALMLGAGAVSPEPIDVLLPIRVTSLFRWCLAQGLRVVKPMTLMTIGEYHDPHGSWFPSVAY